MAILIDPPAWPAHGRLWSHLVSDRSLEELHEFARVAGVPERGFEGDHYDVPAERYDDLVSAGAHPVGPRELLARLQKSGLRRPKRRGERVVGSVEDGGTRSDAVRSALDPPEPARAVTVIVGWRGRFLVEAGGAPPRLPSRGADPESVNPGSVKPGSAEPEAAELEVPDLEAPDLEAAAAFVSRTLPAAVPAWVRVGYVRSVAAAPEHGRPRTPTGYESLLAASLSWTDPSAPDEGRWPAPPRGMRWVSGGELLAGVNPAHEPLVRIVVAQAES